MPASHSKVFLRVLTCIPFTVPGPPVAKQRPRVTKSGHTYTPKETQHWESTCRILAHQAMQGAKPHEGAVSLRITAHFQIPKTWPKWKLKAEPWATVGKDLDNIAKAVLDACNGVVYADDRQVVELHVNKHYDETPKVEVEARFLAGVTTQTKRNTQKNSDL